MESPTPAKKPKIFYGYWIVVAAFFFSFVFSGCGFYAFSLFVKRLHTDFGWGRAEMNLTLTIFFLIGGMMAPLVGRLVDRYGVRGVMAVGALVAGLGFALISQMSELWHFYGGYIIVGLGMAGTGMTPTTTVISN